MKTVRSHPILAALLLGALVTIPFADVDAAVDNLAATVGEDGFLSAPTGEDTQLDSDYVLVVDAFSYEQAVPIRDTRKNPDVLTPVCPLPAGGLDHAAAGTGLRNSGDGTIRLRGVDPRATLADARLYWGLITGVPAPLAVTATFEGHRVTGTLIGTAAQCWGLGKTYAFYRANVTSLMPPVIDGDYKVDCVDSNLDNDADPWDGVNNNNLVVQAQGATLLVQFIDPDLPAPSVVYINEGPFFMAGAVLTTIHPLIPPTPGPNSKHTRFGADGQVGTGGPFGGVTPLGLGVTGIGTFIGPTGGPLTQIKGVGSALNSDSDWNGYDGEPLNQLWDTHSTGNPFGTSFIPAGSPSYTVSYTPGAPVGAQDCVNPSVHVLTAN